MTKQVAEWRTRAPHPDHFRLMTSEGVELGLAPDTTPIAALRMVMRDTGIILQYPQTLVDGENKHEQV